MQGHALIVETEIVQTIIARGGDSLSRSRRTGRPPFVWRGFGLWKTELDP